MVALFVALMFVLLVLLDLGVEKWRGRRESVRARKAPGPGLIGATTGRSPWCQLPEGFHVSAGHAWFRPDPTGGLEVGGDAFLAHALGTVSRVVLPEIGRQISAGQPLFRLEHQGRSIVIPSALSGRVLAVNSRLEDHPEWLHTDSYGTGWVCYLVPTSRDEIGIPFGQKALRWLESEFVRFREFLAARAVPDLALGVTNLDGGMPAAGCLGELDASSWAAFEVEFCAAPEIEPLAHSPGV